MALYSIANRTSATAAASANQEVIAAAAVGYRIMEFGFTQNAATAGVFGIGVPAAKGITPTTPVTVLAEDQNNTTAGNTQTALAWGTGPTVPANFFRRASMPANIGAGLVWTFPRGLTQTKNLSIVMWIVATAPVLDTWVVVDE